MLEDRLADAQAALVIARERVALLEAADDRARAGTAAALRARDDLWHALTRSQSGLCALLLQEMLAAISQQRHTAAWASGVEFEVWEDLQQWRAADGFDGAPWLSDAEAIMLDRVADGVQGWRTWPPGTPAGPRFLPLDAWQQLHAARASG